MSSSIQRKQNPPSHRRQALGPASTALVSTATLIYDGFEGWRVPILRPCKNTAAFEALPDDKRLQVDLDALETTLTGLGWRTVVNAAVMLIVEKQIEVSIYRSGKLLIKTRDPDEAVRVFRVLHPHLEPTASHEPDVQDLERLAKAAPVPTPRRN